jgi:hypothetical protein
MEGNGRAAGLQFEPCATTTAHHPVPFALFFVQRQALGSVETADVAGFGLKQVYALKFFPSHCIFA